MSNELVLIETRIHEGDAALDAADKHLGKVVEFKKTAGLIYVDAKQMCEAQGLVFKAECKRVTSRSYSQVCRVMQVANAPDPDAEHKRQMEMQATWDKKHRDGRVASTSDYLDVWEEPKPSKACPIDERPHVKAIKAGLMNCSPEEREHVLTWATCL